MSKKTVALIILDGWGIGRDDATNPIHIVKPQTFSYLAAHFPHGALQASGIAVGLPWGEEGNSEVGHLTIGAGKIIYQHLPRISMAIENGEFFKNTALLAAIEHAKKDNGAVHLVGILAQGNVHASLNHLLALIKLCAQQEALVQLHLFSDGKDSPQKSFLQLLEKIKLGDRVTLASVSGRYYAMDRDAHWDRTELCYNALIGKATVITDVRQFTNDHYRKGLSDEYVQPVVVGAPANAIHDNDAVIFFNYREDSIRQIAAPFVDPSFKSFHAECRKNIFVVTMTQYFEKSAARVAFPSERIKQPLGKVVADAGKIQLRIAETEKYAHVTFFFNGLQDMPLANEYRVLIPSQGIAHHDEHPEMMASEITTRIIQTIEDRSMDFILANYANADVIAHTGNFNAGVQAVRVLDQEIDKVVRAALANDAILVITADHGNIEQMINPITGLPEAKHNPSPVPVYIVGKEFERGENQESEIRNYGTTTETVGLLSDVAPTILELMDIPKPAEMTGESLLSRLA